jgi:hypothetical protein
LIKAGGEQLALGSINLLLLFGIRRNCLRSERSQKLYLFIRREIKQIVVIIAAVLPTMYKILSNILLSRLTPYIEDITGDHQCGF